jgi:hypothetical protein
LRSLNANRVEYLLIGGYAVGYHGYPRPTGDLDVWIAVNPENAVRAAQALVEFGFANATATLFERAGPVIRMGMPPVRIEVQTAISGVEFGECYASRIQTELDGVSVTIIDLEHLKQNKRAAARHKDLADLENLP